MSLKQSSKEPATSKPGMASPRWGRERERDCLRIETLEGSIFLLPYQQFIVAHLQRQEGDDALNISFASHEICLKGRHLDEIMAALQEYAVDWITPTPARYNSLSEGASAIIATLEIKPVN